MKLIKGKKQEKDKKKLPEPPKPPSVPGPQAPVRIQIEPRKAGSISLEVGGGRPERKRTVPKEIMRNEPEVGFPKEGTKRPQSRSRLPLKAPTPIPRPPVRAQPKPRKPSVTVPIFDSPKIPTPKPKKKERPERPAIIPAPEKPQAFPQADARKLRQRVDSLDKSIGTVARELEGIKSRINGLPDRKQVEDIRRLLTPSIASQLRKIAEKTEEPAQVSEADMRLIRQFIARSGGIDSQIAGVKVDLGNALRSVDSFVERFGSLQKEFTDIKIKLAMSREGKVDKDVSQLKDRMDEMEGLLEKMSEKSSESKPGKPVPAAEMKAVIEKISGLESGMKSMREGMASLNSRISVISEKKPLEAQDFSPAVPKNTSERLDAFDSRIAGIADKLMRLSEDMQKLTSYFMEGIKHLESRIRIVESEKEAEKRISDPSPEPDFVPTTYRSHLKMKPTAGIEADMDMEDFDMPRRRPAPTGPRVAMPQPPPKPSAPAPTLPTPSYGGYPSVPSPASAPFPRSQANLPPPAPMPERGSMFTMLRESTVIRRPIPQEDPDMDIILEHIRESMHKQESREKIQRDLMNAGFEQELINRAFMKARVG